MLTHVELNAKASILAGTPVTVSCDSDDSFLNNPMLLDGAQVQGYVIFDDGVPQNVIHLRRKLCTRLQHLGEDAHHFYWDMVNQHDEGYGPKADEPDGSALATLEHEALHIRERETDESRVECDNYKNRWTAIKVFRPMKRWVQLQIYWGMKINHQDSLPMYRRYC